METTALIDERTLQSSNLSKSFEGLAIVHQMKGYCVPTSVIEESNEMLFIENQSACPDDLTEFVAVQCFNSSKSDNVNIEDGISQRQRRHCLNAKDVVRLNKCGDGWVSEITKGSSCLCSQVHIRHFPALPESKPFEVNHWCHNNYSWIFLLV